MRRGIVLSNLKYGDNSNIIKLYTLDHGIDSVIVSSGKKNRKVALLQALSEVDFITSKVKGRGLARAKEIKSTNRFNYPLHPSVHGIRYFLAEFLSNILQEEESNLPLYTFLTKQLNVLCKDDKKSAYIISFLIQIAPYLGFNIIDKDHVESSILSEQDFQLINAFSNGTKLNKTQRSSCLEILIRFYDLQFNRISKMKTLSVLRDTFE